MTIAVRRVPLAEASRMGILALDDNDRVIEWQEKPKQPKSDLASMGVYVFSKKALRTLAVARTASTSGAHVIPAMLEAGARVFGYRYNGYWQDVGTIQSYWEANMALLDDEPELDLYDKDWVIHTRSEERAPAKVGPTAQVHRSLISHGCVINGTVVNSVLSPGVRVEVGRGRARLDRHVRLGHPVRRRRRPGDPRQGGRRRPGRASSATGPTTTGRTSRSPAGSTPGSRSSASGRSIPAAPGIGRNVQDRRRRPHRPTSRARDRQQSGESVEIRECRGRRHAVDR